jgi:hypothetical protein
LNFSRVKKIVKRGFCRVFNFPQDEEYTSISDRNLHLLTNHVIR